MGKTPKLAKSNQEQAVAAWVNHLNQLRLDGLLGALARQDENLQNALASVDNAIARIGLEIVAANRGGVKGMHGFIAEVAEEGVGNARSQILGGRAVYQWVNDNGPVDLMRSGVAIQQKFVADGGRFGLGAIADHLQRYPDFIANGGKYQIPGDHFEVIQKLHGMSPENANKLLSRSGDGPSLKDWTRIHAFFEAGPIDIESLEPSNLDYHDVQRGTYGSTLEVEKRSLRSSDQTLRDEAHQTSRPTLREGMKATLAAAAVEGSTAFLLAVIQKRRAGKKLAAFTYQDWTGVAADTGLGLAQGGIRSLSIYSLTNFTATPAAAANSLVTAALGVAEQANMLRRGEIDEVEFIENSEIVTLHAAVSALSSFMGQALIPIPVLGAVIGNTVGTIMYRAAASSLAEHEAAILEEYLAEQHLLDAQLAGEYQDLLARLDESLTAYFGLLERAFSPNIEVALLGSVDLAVECGVAGHDVLDSEERVLAYFLE